jgi:hypothetical protein
VVTGPAVAEEPQETLPAWHLRPGDVIRRDALLMTVSSVCLSEDTATAIVEWERGTASGMFSVPRQNLVRLVSRPEAAA